MTKLFCSYFLVTAFVCAAGPGGTVPGYILDTRSASIRAIYGMPGALQLSAPLGLPFGVASAAFAPAGDYALAIAAQQPAHAFFIQSFASVPAITDLGPVADGTRVLAVNASGSAALLYAGDGSAVQFITGLPQAPAISGNVAASALAGAITAAALDNAGTCAILGTGALETLCADGTWQRVLPIGMDISDLVLSNKGENVILADRAAKQILLVRQYAQSPSVAVLAGAEDGIDAPVGLQAISATTVLAADSGASAVFVIDLTGGVGAIPIEVNIAPTQLRSLADRSILLLNDVSAMPFTIMDVQTMRTFFIPTN